MVGLFEAGVTSALPVRCSSLCLNRSGLVRVWGLELWAFCNLEFLGTWGGREEQEHGACFIGISESVNVNVIYNLFNRYDDFLNGATYLKPLFFYVPRSIWEGKPETITVIAANSFGGNALVTTIIGEMYMNFSIFGIVLLPVFLWFTEGLLTKYLKNYGSILSIIGFFFGILFFRMPYSDELLVFVFLVFILTFFNVFKKYKFKFNIFN